MPQQQELREDVRVAMAPPDAGADAERRRLVVLLHGIRASAASWDPLLALCRDDERLRQFDFETFSYATGLARWKPTQRLPDINAIASDLGGYLSQHRLAHYRDIRLVGHSQGGLVIQRYVHQMLEAGRGRELDRIRQITFFATPTLGSELFGTVRRILFAVVGNLQERELRVFNSQVGATRRFLDEHVSNARERARNTAQIPIHVFYGQEDNVVDPESAMGSFSSCYAIPGDHSGLITPTDDQDRRYSAFADMLLEPIGHRHVFELESSEYALRLEPANAAAPLMAPLPDGKSRAVTTECIGHFRRRVRFAPGNRCEDLFEMRYATRDDGYVDARVIPPNQWSDLVRRDYEQRGTNFRYHFVPVQRSDDWYTMHLKLYRAFEPGNRTLHFHTTRAGDTSWARVRNLRFEMDWRGLLDAGWKVNREPELFLLDIDRQHEECPKHGDEEIEGALGELVNPVDDERGRRKWALTELNRGIVNVLWDIEPPRTQP